MDDLCTLAQYHADDLSTHAVSLAVMARALNDAYESGGHWDRQAFHRAADLALALYREEKRRYESADNPAPLLDTLYLKAFVSDEEPEAQPEPQPEARRSGSRSRRVAARFSPWGTIRRSTSGRVARAPLTG